MSVTTYLPNRIPDTGKGEKDIYSRGARTVDFTSKSLDMKNEMNQNAAAIIGRNTKKPSITHDSEKAELEETEKFHKDKERLEEEDKMNQNAAAIVGDNHREGHSGNKVETKAGQVGGNRHGMGEEHLVEDKGDSSATTGTTGISNPVHNTGPDRKKAIEHEYNTRFGPRYGVTQEEFEAAKKKRWGST